MARPSRLTPDIIACFFRDAETLDLDTAAKRAGISRHYAIKLMYQQRHQRMLTTLEPLRIGYIQSSGRGDLHKLIRKRDGAVYCMTSTEYKFLLSNPVGYLKFYVQRIRETWDLQSEVNGG